jgi:hypothetical protein
MSEGEFSGTSGPDDVAILDCDGWWEQPILGRQAMRELRMAFAEGRVRGAGKDIVGEFLFNGTISPDGQVVMVKQYIGRHSVNYVGNYDGEGLMWGRWSLGLFRGPWMIRIGRLGESASAEIEELQEDT